MPGFRIHGASALRARPGVAAGAWLATALMACALPAPAQPVPAAASSPGAAHSAAAPGPWNVQIVDFPDLADTRRSRPVPIKAFVPQAAAPTGTDDPHPLVLMSHGGGGSRDANFAQSRHLASHGFVVLALEHVGSGTARLMAGGQFLANLREMTRDRDELRHRPLDARFALEMAAQWQAAHPQLRGRIALDRVALVGHSYGAYTALVGCGARVALDWMQPPAGSGLGEDVFDARLMACVAYSPQGPGEPFFHEASYASIRRPVLHVSGSRDVTQTGDPPAVRRSAFERSPPMGQVLLWLDNADHNAFSDSTGSGRRSLASPAREAAQPAVRAATLAFLQRHLLGRPGTEAVLNAEALRPLLGSGTAAVELLQR